jgi:UDP-glucose 4-epimerase
VGGGVKILVTGGFGYLGAHLAAWFCDRGHDVAVLARPGARAGGVPACRLLAADITEPGSLCRALTERFDVCLHLASANDAFVEGYPELALRVNAGGTRNLLAALKPRPPRKFVYFSTVHVYGPAAGRVDEDTPPRPANDYALTHLFAEHYVRWFHQSCGLPYLVLRLTNAYGAPRQIDSGKWHLVLNDLARMAHDQGRIALTSNGSASRDFIWVGDVCRIVGQLAESDAAVNQTLNVGAGRCRQVIELARIVQDVYRRRYGAALDVTVNPEDKSAAAPVQVDVSRLQAVAPGEAHDRVAEEVGRIFDLLDGAGADGG